MTFIALTSMHEVCNPKPLHIFAASVEGITTDRHGSRDLTLVRTASGGSFYISETPSRVLALIGDAKGKSSRNVSTESKKET
jgi:hypothetical protein